MNIHRFFLPTIFVFGLVVGFVGGIFIPDITHKNNTKPIIIEDFSLMITATADAVRRKK